jgi:1,4-alpha-glucan branching enzyme
MLDKMPGDVWQKFANLRLLYGYQWGHPGKKLIFMGSEFGQWQEWSEARSLDWHLIDSADAKHAGLKRFVTDLNNIYQHYPALYAEEFSWQGFEWLDFRDFQRSILAFARMDPASGDLLLVACNFTPVVRMATVWACLSRANMKKSSTVTPPSTVAAAWSMPARCRVKNGRGTTRATPLN